MAGPFAQMTVTAGPFAQMTATREAPAAPAPGPVDVSALQQWASQMMGGGALASAGQASTTDWGQASTADWGQTSTADWGQSSTTDWSQPSSAQPAMSSSFQIQTPSSLQIQTPAALGMPSMPSSQIQTPSSLAKPGMPSLQIKTPTALAQESGGEFSNWLKEDWFCPVCQDLQFARNLQCRKCGAPNPNPESAMPSTRIPDAISGYVGADGRLKKGFKPKKVCAFFLEGRCRKGAMCTYAHSEDDLHGGAGPEAWVAQKENPKWAKEDWTCPCCGDLQFARNAACRKCGTPNPNDAPRVNNNPNAGSAAGLPSFAGVSVSMDPAAAMPMAKPAIPIPSPPLDMNSNETKLCSAHFKKRSVRNLVPDDLGGYRCQEGFECQTGGGPGGKGRERKPLPLAANGQPVSFIGAPVSSKPLSPGDWMCPSCNDHQFARNIQCRRCAFPRPEGFGPQPKGEGKGGRNGPYNTPSFEELKAMVEAGIAPGIMGAAVMNTTTTNQLLGIPGLPAAAGMPAAPGLPAALGIPGIPGLAPFM